jgi:hypothetical protein
LSSRDRTAASRGTPGRRSIGGSTRESPTASAGMAETDPMGIRTTRAACVGDRCETRVRLRQMRDKERTLAFQKRHEVRGKLQSRDQSFPGAAERSLQRKPVVAAALKRVNKEIGWVTKLQAREALIDASHQALALRRLAQVRPHPSATDTGQSGMRLITTSKRRTCVLGGKIGRVSGLPGDEKRSSRSPPHGTRCLSRSGLSRECGHASIEHVPEKPVAHHNHAE